MVIPAVLNFENLGLVGVVLVAFMLKVFFPTLLGFSELLFIGLLWAILAFPSFRKVFMNGSTSYVLTNRRLVIFTVNFRNNEQSIPLDQIDNAKYKPSGLQRFYGAGDILVRQKGFKKSIRLVSLPNCRQFVKMINQAVKTSGSK